jgi:hypothetical protein
VLFPGFLIGCASFGNGAAFLIEHGIRRILDYETSSSPKKTLPIDTLARRTERKLLVVSRAKRGRKIQRATIAGLNVKRDASGPDGAEAGHEEDAMHNIQLTFSPVIFALQEPMSLPSLCT